MRVNIRVNDGTLRFLERQVFRFLRKYAILSHDFNAVGSSFQMLGAATEKAHGRR